jgi:hypothetical protein
MINTKYKFASVYLTKDYYPMFEGCIYENSRANFNDINVINVDMGSLPENFVDGKDTCSRLGIKMADEGTTSMQEGLKVADNYLTKCNIDVDWMLCFQHDTFPLKNSFWDDLQEIMDEIDYEKVGMIGGNMFSKYDNGVAAFFYDDIVEACYGKTRTGRGMLARDVCESPYHGWYMNLPDEYYQSQYFAVESPYWVFFAINRKLFNKYIEVDKNFVFELWPDDLAHQFLTHGIVNISVPKLYVCHDHKFRDSVMKINAGKLIEPRHDFCHSTMRFWSKWGFRWGTRRHHQNAIKHWGDLPEAWQDESGKFGLGGDHDWICGDNLRKQFEMTTKKILPEHALQHKFFELDINDGPLDLDLQTKAPVMKK